MNVEQYKPFIAHSPKDDAVASILETKTLYSPKKAKAKGIVHTTYNHWNDTANNVNDCVAFSPFASEFFGMYLEKHSVM